jgi:hypothetical protein
MAKNTQLAPNAPLVDCVEPSARYPLGISGPGAGIFGAPVGSPGIDDGAVLYRDHELRRSGENDSLPFPDRFDAQGCGCGANQANDARPPAGIFGGIAALSHTSGCDARSTSPRPGEPDAIDRLAAIGADVTTMYDFTLAQFLRDRGMDPEPEHPVWLPVEDRDWYTLLTMRLMALAFSDEPEWRERWRP